MPETLEIHNSQQSKLIHHHIDECEKYINTKRQEVVKMALKSDNAHGDIRARIKELVGIKLLAIDFIHTQNKDEKFIAEAYEFNTKRKVDTLKNNLESDLEKTLKLWGASYHNDVKVVEERNKFTVTSGE